MENTEVMKKIEDIRAHTAGEVTGEIKALQKSGRYEAADRLLHAVQVSLAELKNIERQAESLLPDETAKALDAWEKLYDAAVRRVCGAPEPEDEDETAVLQLCRSGAILLDAGVMPSGSQLRAMNLTEEAAQKSITAQKLKNAAFAAQKK